MTSEGTRPIWYAKIPERLRGGLERYRDSHVRTGHFLEAVISNDLRSAVQHGDSDSIAAIREIVWWLERELPSEAFGSRSDFAHWISYRERFG